ncbi:MAG: gliding motility-associated C-terminal domain-containing protein [Bacteroidota bacterium]|nr:gliding motility-associated C-terminal domain-containing protein [Bacteroidota bacterium]
MKKLLLIASVFFLYFSSLEIKAQGIDSINVTQPIICHGDLATATAYINQTNPPTSLSYVLQFQNQFGFWVQLGFSAQGTGNTSPFTGLFAGTFRVLIVDSALYRSTVPPGQNPNSIYDVEMFNIIDVPPLVATTTTITPNLCFGDCSAEERITITGGTPPYTVTDINSGAPLTLALISIDTIYSALCAGTYSVTVTDVNNCNTSPSPTTFTINSLDTILVNGSITSNYNGQDISCSGGSDGEITAIASGGTPPYIYSIDGINFSTNNIFTGLSAGAYTITYRDANGCDTSEVFILTDPPGLSGGLTIDQQVTCNSSCDGQIRVIVDNILTGTPPHTYSIDGGITFQSIPIFSNLCGDLTYNVIIQDANNCQFATSIFLSQPTAITFNATSSDYNGFGVSCNSLTDGQIVIFPPSGGTPPYTYSIDGGVTYSNITIYNGLAAGSYLVTVQDASGCTNDTTIVITEPGLFSITPTITSNYNGSNVSCHGICDGSAIVFPQNGVGVITYDLTSFLPQTSNTWSGLCGAITFGTYTVNATDANGCTATSSFALTEPQPWVYTVDSITETCNSSNGEASINVTQGGTGVYAYLWDDPSQQITSTATGLTTGLYEVRVTDVNGCTFTEDIFVLEADITLSFDSVPPCNNANDGSATVYPNGTPPYMISWNTGNPADTTNTITGLSPGFYSVTVTDATGCIVTDSVEIPPSSIVEIVLDSANSTLHVACFGDPSNIVTVNATGGTGPNTYLYYIPNVFPVPQTSNVFQGLFAGTYTIFAIDANGCSDSLIVTITQPEELMFATGSTDVSCYGGSDGTAFLDTVRGGTVPYTYTWSTGANTTIINNLQAGIYILSITDSSGCISNPVYDTVIVNEPPELQSSISILSHARCAGIQTYAEGELQVSISGGTPGYSYVWNTNPTQTSTTIINLMPGIYSVTATDALGCSISDSAEILPGLNPNLDVIVQNVSCFGANDGMMFTSASSGTPPYQFSANGGVTFVPPGTPFGPSGPASYFITVYDSLGCTDADSVFVVEPSLLQITNVNVQNVTCYDSANGELTVQHIGGTSPFTYLWDDSNGQTLQTATNLSPGSYSVIVTDTMGCLDTSNLVGITQPDSLYISNISSTSVLCYGGNTGTVSVSAAGGTPGYSYLWSTGAITSSDTALVTGTYSVNVLDSNGCSRSSNIIVDQPLPLTVMYIKDSVQCIGGSDGWATALVSGGVTSYSYLWENGDTTVTSSNLEAGYHTLTITDLNGCVLIDSVEILEPDFSIEIDSLIINPMTCHNANNASITVLATGGHQPYLYSNTNGFNMQSTIGFLNIAEGTYIMYVEDIRGCVDRDTIHISSPDSLYIDTTIFSHVSCFGYNNGSIQAINASGGTPFLDLLGNPYYEYSVNGGQHYSSMAYFNSYPPGIYTVEVFDANNCAAQDIIIIEEPTELDVTITTSFWNGYEIRCHGDTSGFANIQISGGEPPYIRTCVDILGDTVAYDTDFTFDNSSGYHSLTGISSGVYTFIIQDAYGCIDTTMLHYAEPDLISHNFIATHVTCEGWNNGSLIDSVYGGVGNATTYIYAWNTGDSTYSLSGIGVGTYTITVVDENNCISTSSYTINSNGALNTSINNSATEDVTCHDYCDGVIGVNVSGGVPNINQNGNPVYSYSWDDILSQNTPNAIGLCVNNTTNQTTYTCVVTDAQGCTDTISYVLEQPEELVVTAQVLEGVSCNGLNDGKLKAFVVGGTPSYSAMWNNGVTGNTNSGLSSGSYVVVVEDSKGCMDTTEIYLPEPSQHYVSNISYNDVACWGESTGSITIDVDSGTVIGIQEYAYYWSNGIIDTTQISTISNLDTGVYYVDIFDNNGCQITSQFIYISQPANPLTIRVDSTDETCLLNDGAAIAYVLGGTSPYTYSWSNGFSTNPISGLVAGMDYSVIVTDANGCRTIDAPGYQASDATTYVNGVRNIFLPGNLDVIDTSLCLGHELELNIEEKNNLTYSWQVSAGDANIIPNSEFPDIKVTPNTSGIHILDLIITDPSCLNSYSVRATINVTDLDPELSSDPMYTYLNIGTALDPKNIKQTLQVSLESVELTSNYLGANYTWTWDETETSSSRIITVNPEKSTWYYLEVEDDNGCVGYDTIYVVIGVIPYDAISPNEDSYNDTWTIKDIESHPDARIQIFNRWGMMIFDSPGGHTYSSTPWDGKHEGKDLPIGTYYYVINLNNGGEPQLGTITIVR